MKAAVITHPGGPEVLEIQDVPRPLPRAGEVLVRVRASALNRADLLQRQGRYPAPPGAPAQIPGLELAGEVEDAAPDVTRWKAGDRVFGIIAGGGHAQYAVVPANELVQVPAAMSWDDAAAIPEAFITAHDALVTQAELRAGEAVLVHAVGSGVGLAAAQLARALRAVCIGTARTADKLERARDLGMTHGILVEREPDAFVPEVLRLTRDVGAAVVLDLVGGPYLASSVECAAPRARIVLVGLLAGRSTTLNLGTVLTRRLLIRGTVLRTRLAAEKAEATAAFARDVLPLIESGTVRATVDRVFSLDQVREAHALLESNATFGKIVLRMP